MGRNNKAAAALVVIGVLATLFNVASFFFPDLETINQGGIVSSTASSLVKILVLLFVAFVAYRRGVKGALLYFSLIMCAVVFLLIRAVDYFGVSNPALLLLSYAASGGVAALSLVLLGSLLTCFEKGVARNVVISGFVLAAAVMLICWLQPLIDPAVLRLALFLCSLISITLFYVRAPQTERSSTSRIAVAPQGGNKHLGVVSLLSSMGMTAAVTYLSSVLFSLVFGLFEAYFSFENASGGLDALALTIVAIMGGASLCASLVKNSQAWFNGLFFAICIATIISIPLMLVFPAYDHLFFSVLVAAVALLQIPVWIFLIDVSKNRHISPVYLFGLFPAVLALSHTIGRVVSWTLLLTLGAGESYVSYLASGVLAFVAIAAVIALTIVLRNKATAQPHDLPTDAPENARDQAFSQLCASFDLTERECDIVRLYAQGRSVPFISDQLYIAKSTVKTHIGNVYAKMDVHSKQELMSFVTEFTDQER